MKQRLITLLLVLVLLAGAGLLAYPSVSDYWNSMHASQAVSAYNEEVQRMDPTRYDELWAAARNFNRVLREQHGGTSLTDEQRAKYDSFLDIDGTGIMGYIEIPNIKVSLPIYHGTADSVLQIAVGHLEWSSLPTGGAGTHCVLSGHRGLPSAKLFTNLDKLVVGDTFVLRALDEVLTYEVDQILIVEPQDVSALQIEAGKDLCTLVTCTPYGINTHRLLVRGHRVENRSESIRVTSDATQVEPLLVAPVVALPMLLMLLVLLLLPGGKRKKKHG